MDDLGLNKIAAAVLASALGFFAIKEVSHLTFSHHGPETPAYALEIPDLPAGGGEAVDLPFPTTEWVAAMDPTRGAKVFKKCVSCHNADQGGVNGTGPNLWSIVGSPAAQSAGFKYSGALKSAEITWDFETLDGFLAKPTKYLKGTNMNFIGLKKDTDRAAVIAYLQGQSNNPLPAPKAAEVMMEDGDKMDAMVEGEKMDAMKDDVMMEDGAKLDTMKDTMKDGADKMDAMIDKGLAKEDTMAKEIMTDVGEKMDALKDDVMKDDVMKDGLETAKDALKEKAGQ